MRYFYLLAALIYINTGYSQCTVPPPLGFNEFYSIDLDNDGYTTFDVGYYMEYIERPLMESIHGVSSSGYEFVFYNSNNEIVGPIYTNLMAGEFCAIHFEYSGSGPIFMPLPPCFWPVPTFASIVLIPLPYNGDFDGDGILNIDEDTNGNLNLMDDDADNDGYYNFADDINSLSLAVPEVGSLSLYPNPVTDGKLYFQSGVGITAVTIYDITGKKILEEANPITFINLKDLQSGTYLIRLNAENGVVHKKIIIN